MIFIKIRIPRHLQCGMNLKYELSLSLAPPGEADMIPRSLLQGQFFESFCNLESGLIKIVFICKFLNKTAFR